MLRGDDGVDKTPPLANGHINNHDVIDDDNDHADNAATNVNVMLATDPDDNDNDNDDDGVNATEVDRLTGNADCDDVIEFVDKGGSIRSAQTSISDTEVPLVGKKY